MVNSVIPAANPAIGYSQWVTSIMHAPETLGLPLGTAKVKTWTLHGGFETLRLHDGPNSKLLRPLDSLDHRNVGLWAVAGGHLVRNGKGVGRRKLVQTVVH